MIQIQTSGWGIDSQERERIHRQLMVQQRGAWASRGAAQHYSIKSLCSGKLSCKSIVSPGYLYIILFIVNHQSNPTPSVILVPFPRCTTLSGWKVPNPISSNVFFFFTMNLNSRRHIPSDDSSLSAPSVADSSSIFFLRRRLLLSCNRVNPDRHCLGVVMTTIRRKFKCC